MESIFQRVSFTQLSYAGFSVEVVHTLPECLEPGKRPSDIIVDAARVSFNGKAYADPEKNDRLLKRLYDDRHTSPFEMAVIVYKIRVPKFVAIQLLRHRTFRFNELSQRYREISLGHYSPLQEDSFLRAQSKRNHQMSIQFTEEEKKKEVVDIFSEIEGHLAEVEKLYHSLVKSGVSKESARYCLPMGTWTDLVMSCDMNNLMKFFSLRLGEDAQYETRIVAQMMYRLMVEFFPEFSSFDVPIGEDLAQYEKK